MTEGMHCGETGVEVDLSCQRGRTCFPTHHVNTSAAVMLDELAAEGPTLDEGPLGEKVLLRNSTAMSSFDEGLSCSDRGCSGYCPGILSAKQGLHRHHHPLLANHCYHSHLAVEYLCDCVVSELAYPQE